jgi:hypothetical protein
VRFYPFPASGDGTAPVSETLNYLPPNFILPGKTVRKAVEVITLKMGYTDERK